MVATKSIMGMTGTALSDFGRIECQIPCPRFGGMPERPDNPLSRGPNHA